MQIINIKPSFLQGCSEIPWIERFEARGWKVPDKVKYSCGVRPSTFYCREYDVVMGWGKFDCLQKITEQDGVKINIYFED